MPSTISLERATPCQPHAALIASFPEVESVVSHRAVLMTGLTRRDLSTRNFSARPSPTEQWRPGLTKDALTSEILAGSKPIFPAVEFNFCQYLQDNVAEAVSG